MPFTSARYDLRPEDLTFLNLSDPDYDAHAEWLAVPCDDFYLDATSLEDMALEGPFHFWLIEECAA